MGPWSPEVHATARVDELVIARPADFRKISQWLSGVQRQPSTLEYDELACEDIRLLAAAVYVLSNADKRAESRSSDSVSSAAALPFWRKFLPGLAATFSCCSAAVWFGAPRPVPLLPPSVVSLSGCWPLAEAPSRPRSREPFHISSPLRLPLTTFLYCCILQFAREVPSIT